MSKVAQESRDGSRAIGMLATLEHDGGACRLGQDPDGLGQGRPPDANLL
jgi:hypothetical protein